MAIRRVLYMLVGVVLMGALVMTVMSPAQGKTLVGTSCTKLGAQIGDGPSRTVECKKVGKKKIWQLLTASYAHSNSPAPTHSSVSTCKALPVFTADFIDPKYVRGVTPIGGQTGSGGVIALRSYVYPSNDFAGQKLPIYAPVAMSLTAASYYKSATASASYQPEYSLYFDAGCGISVKFFHIKGVVGSVAGVVPKEPSTSSGGQQVKPTKVVAGEQIGWYELGENSVAFDFWVDNQAYTDQFIVPSHFATQDGFHSVCPYDFYTPEKRSIWLSKMGGNDGIPVAGTDCGVVNQGQAGTVDGLWFATPNTKVDQLTWDGFYQSQIMFHADGSNVIRIGGLNATQPLHQMFTSPSNTTWAKPTDIKVGATHCWTDDVRSDRQQSAKVLLTSATTLTVVVGLGSCEALPDISTGKNYYR